MSYYTGLGLSIATSYNNTELIYFSISNYSTAIVFFEEALIATLKYIETFLNTNCSFEIKNPNNFYL